MLHTIVFKVLEVLQFFILLGIRFIKIFTARKRSLESKVMFLHLSVILFTGGGGICVQRGFCRGGLCPGMTGVSVQGISGGGGLCPGTRGIFQSRVSVQGGLCQRPPPPPYGKEWAARILLECSLVFIISGFPLFRTDKIP